MCGDGGHRSDEEGEGTFCYGITRRYQYVLVARDQDHVVYSFFSFSFFLCIIYLESVAHHPSSPNPEVLRARITISQYPDDFVISIQRV
jgi:hypothetical protein